MKQSATYLYTQQEKETHQICSPVDVKMHIHIHKFDPILWKHMHVQHPMKIGTGIEWEVKSCTNFYTESHTVIANPH